MTAPIVPVEIDTLSTPPTIADQANFDERADQHVLEVVAMVPQINAATAATYQNAVSANEGAVAAQAQAVISTTQAGIAADKVGLAADQVVLATTQAGLAAASAASALNAPGTSATSTTSLTIGSGAKSLTIQTGKLFAVGQTVVIARASDPITQMTGVITAHNNGTGALSVTISTNGFAGSGTFTDWTISLSGAKGEKGDTSSLIRVNRSSNTMLTAADNGKYFNLTGTFTQTFDTPANLGNGWFCYIRNVNTDGTSGLGITSTVMYPEEERRFDCDGTTIRSIVINPFKFLSTGSGTFFKPTGYSAFGGLIWGAGGSGAASRTTNPYNMGGGAAACTPIWYASASMPASVSFTIGAGGTAVTAGAGASIAGNDGGNSVFGAFTAYGGVGGGTSSAGSGMSGAGIYGKATNQAGGVVYSIGGKPDGNSFLFTPNSLGIVYQNASTYGGGGGGVVTTSSNPTQCPHGGDSVYGGAGGAGAYSNDGTNINVVGNAGNSVYGGTAGASIIYNAPSTTWFNLPVGTSTWGGTGGVGSFGTGARTGTAGGVRGGGGGAAVSTNDTSAVSGAGGRGELQLWGIL